MGERITPGVEIPDGATSVTGDTPSDDATKVKKVASSSRKRQRKSDSPPKKKATAPKAEASNLTTAQIEHALAEVLTFPAIPCSAVGDQWAADHFSTQGRVFAANIAAHSETNPTLRKWCERIASGEAFGVLALSGVMYFLPPMIHWGIIPVPSSARGLPFMPPEGETVPPENPGMATEPDNASNGNNAGQRHERHTP